VNFAELGKEFLYCEGTVPVSDIFCCLPFTHFFAGYFTTWPSDLLVPNHSPSVLEAGNSFLYIKVITINPLISSVELLD
jgi:hypothetical protein